MRTTVSIIGLQVYGYHGLFEQERRLGQQFRFDIRANLKRTDSHSRDNFDCTVRYEHLVEHVTSIATQTQYQSLEALGEHLARSVLQKFACIERVTLEVAKVIPPVPQTVERISVGIEMVREDAGAR